jgi:hypothetical protein
MARRFHIGGNVMISRYPLNQNSAPASGSIHRGAVEDDLPLAHQRHLGAGRADVFDQVARPGSRRRAQRYQGWSGNRTFGGQAAAATWNATVLTTITAAHTTPAVTRPAGRMRGCRRCSICFLAWPIHCWSAARSITVIPFSSA